MQPSTQKNYLADLSGQVERITFASEESGYTVARLKVYGRHDLVTVVGALMSPAPGEILKMRGRWSSHPKYGEQFKVEYYETKVPASVYGIRKYLGSGLIKGIGPKIAERIVASFGTDTLDVIEENTAKLAEVDGIGKKRIAMIQTAWDEQKEVREVMLFLQSHGVSTGYAAKIFKHYGQESIAVVKENPYRLARDIFGIGFLTADKIAAKLGFEKDSPMRAQAGIIYVLHQMADDGHVYYPYLPLITKCREILDVAPKIIETAIADITLEKKIVIEDLNEDADQFQSNHKAVYLQKYHFCESRIASMLMRLKYAPSMTGAIDAKRAVVWAEAQIGIQLAKHQADAVQSVLEHKVMVITGGPGTGKTTLISAILKIFIRMKTRVLLSAPTGRAAKRMTEATGHEAKTVHRMLEYSFQKGGFQKNSAKPLKCDLLIVDEASMIDTILMYHLLRAIPPHAAFILVGDVNQLPSVGAGSVLNDIIASHEIPVAALTQIFRQARQSQIIINAHKINQGILPRQPVSKPANQAPKELSDFYFIEQEDPQKVLDTIILLVQKRIPMRFGFHAVDQIQVLTPMHRGIVGAGNLNTKLQEFLNPREDGLNHGHRKFKQGDKVMQIRNNYDKNVFNGDIGRIDNIFFDNQQVVISFDRVPVTYEFSELDEITLAYAVSVHKAQGSEYPAVVMPVLIQHYMLLQRNLIYTAVTRGRRLVVLVGTRKALAIGVHNNKTHKRYTGLKERLIHGKVEC
jgi:exodeoxyribonuclease V alpha subunit